MQLLEMILPTVNLCINLPTSNTGTSDIVGLLKDIQQDPGFATYRLVLSSVVVPWLAWLVLAADQALIYTIVTTYPFALLVSKLSRIDEATFVPCSLRACTFMKLWHSKQMLFQNIW